MDFFGQNLKKNVQNKKNELDNRILLIWNSLGTKFQLKLTTLYAWTKLTQKGHFSSKKEKTENHHKFDIFNLV